MKRPEALKHFRKKYLQPKLLEQLSTLDTYFRQHLDQLAQELGDTFKKLCRYIQEKQASENKPPIKSIHLSLLRTSFLEQKAIYQWDVQDETGYWDWESSPIVYDAAWCFKLLEQIVPDLEPMRRKYVTNLIPHDLPRFKMQEVSNFHLYVLQAAHYAFRKLPLAAELFMIERQNSFTIFAGEYLDFYQPVYFDSSDSLNRKNLKILLKRKPQRYYQALQKIDLSGEEFQSFNFSYSDLQNSNLNDCNLQQTLLVGTNLRNSPLERTDLSESCIHDADFGHCQLENANFSNALGGVGIGCDPLLLYQSQTACASETGVADKNTLSSFWGVNFSGSTLTQTNFSGADLRGADFRQAVFGQTCFHDCLLDGAKFLKKDKTQLELSKTQIDSIAWEG